MTDEAILSVLKTDLEITSTSRDLFLQNLVTTAKEQIKREGIIFEADSVSDGMLIERYAAYLYRKRKDDASMPRDLRYALNNRLLSQKMKVSN